MEIRNNKRKVAIKIWKLYQYSTNKLLAFLSHIKLTCFLLAQCYLVCICGITGTNFSGSTWYERVQSLRSLFWIV